MGRIAVAFVVSLWAIPISIVVNKIVPDPYMDEIFHIPQAQQYCRGDFKTWDPMITTPPGLYYLSLAYVAPLFPSMWFANSVQSLSELCSTAYLRSTNVLLAIVCSVLVYDLLVNLRPSLGERKTTIYAILLSLYPVHWFFTFLYYTDVASLTAVMAMLLASLKKHYWFSAMLGALAILFRQTNIVWVLFVAANGAIRFAEEFHPRDGAKCDDDKEKQEGNNVLTDNKNIPTSPSLRRRRMNSAASTIKSSNPKMTESQSHDLGFTGEALDIALNLWSLKWQVLVAFAPFLLVLMAFITFVIWNGSIVLGAKEAHVVSPHFAQMMYFALVSAAALAPLHFSLAQATTLFQSFWKNKTHSSLGVLVALSIGFTVVHLFSIAHPYLLADNRHYPFYLWRKVIQAHWMMKYLLVPLYVYSWISIINVLGKSHKKILVLSFVVATALVLVPTPLIEFRYYTTPFFLLFLHSQINDSTKLFFIGALYVFVDIFTMAMFLYRPFHWDHEPGTQRFIW